jgi:hypothetical protein
VFSSDICRKLYSSIINDTTDFSFSAMISTNIDSDSKPDIIVADIRTKKIYIFLMMAMGNLPTKQFLIWIICRQTRYQ